MTSLPDRIEAAILRNEANARATLQTQQSHSACECARQVLRAAEVDRAELYWTRDEKPGSFGYAVKLQLAARYSVPVTPPEQNEDHDQ